MVFTHVFFMVNPSISFGAGDVSAPLPELLAELVEVWWSYVMDSSAWYGTWIRESIPSMALFHSESFQFFHILYIYIYICTWHISIVVYSVYVYSIYILYYSIYIYGIYIVHIDIYESTLKEHARNGHWNDLQWAKLRALDNISISGDVLP